MTSQDYPDPFNASEHVLIKVRQMAYDLEPVLLTSFAQTFSGKKLKMDDIAKRLLGSVGGLKRQIVCLYAQNRLEALRETLQQSQTHTSPDKLKQATTEFLLWGLIISHTSNLPEKRARRHHWIPVCYLRGFNVHKDKRAKSIAFRGIRVVEDQDRRNFHAKQVQAETSFVHPQADKTDGYFKPHTEVFFGHTEQYFGLVKESKSMNAWDETVLYAFWVIQNTRTPSDYSDRGGAVLFDDMNDGFYGRLFNAVDMFKSPHVNVSSGHEKLFFSPMFARRGRFTKKTGMACVFPLTPSQGVVISERQVTAQEACEVVDTSQEVLLFRAAKTKNLVFGK